ncbi:MAG: hypothetical protein QM607_08990 [Microbacterium sp.]
MTEPQKSRRISGGGTVLIVVYAIMALAATGRSVVQIIRDFDNAPLAYTLSTAAAVVYILATLALASSRSQTWYRIAKAAVCFEFAGVVIVGALSLKLPELFAHDATVWSEFGSGYYWVPVVLPWFGIWWLATHNPAKERA